MEYYFNYHKTNNSKTQVISFKIANKKDIISKQNNNNQYSNKTSNSNAVKHVNNDRERTGKLIDTDNNITSIIHYIPFIVNHKDNLNWKTKNLNVKKNIDYFMLKLTYFKDFSYTKTVNCNITYARLKENFKLDELIGYLYNSDEEVTGKNGKLILKIIKNIGNNYILAPIFKRDNIWYVGIFILNNLLLKPKYKITTFPYNFKYIQEEQILLSELPKLDKFAKKNDNSFNLIKNINKFDCYYKLYSLPNIKKMDSNSDENSKSGDVLNNKIPLYLIFYNITNYFPSININYEENIKYEHFNKFRLDNKN